jgi:hypothetical protein
LTYVILLKMRDTDEEVVYEYLVEGYHDDIGVIAYYRQTGEIVILRRHEHKWEAYARHAYSRLKRYIASKAFPDSDVVAWY